MAKLIKFINTREPELAADFVAGQILAKLASGQRVLWLVPGGSAIAVSVAAARKIALQPHHNLIITLTDERYGKLGHPDSSWYQSQKAGFKLPEAELIPVLADADFLETAEVFASNLERELTKADYAIGLFGIGADGHTAGILPHSPAVLAEGLVSAYEAGNFRRITVTPVAISRLDEVVVFAQGEAKWPVLKQLNQEIDITSQPAQTLKNSERLTIFTDYKN